MAHNFRTQKDIFEEALKNTPLKHREDVKGMGFRSFIDRLCDNFLVEKIKAFPSWCEETRRINKKMRKFYYHHGNKGKYLVDSSNEDNYGFSKEGKFYHKWIIPKELEFFMRNCIYENFWDDSNAKVRDSFMKAIIKGTKDSMTLLGEVRAYYGKNSIITSYKENQKRPNFSEKVCC